MTFVVTAKWRAKPGYAEEVAKNLAQHALETRQESGVITFIAHRNKDDDHEFLIYEQFVDAEALKLHESLPHYKRNVIDATLPLLEDRVRKFFEVLYV